MLRKLVISKPELCENAKSICDYVGVPVIGVVKMNGYGLGISTAAKVWYDAGVRILAASEPSEALKLCDMELPDATVLLLAPVYDEQLLSELSARGVVLTVVSKEHAQIVADACELPRVHVKVDVGMGRFGTSYSEPERIAQIYSVSGLGFDGIFAHFSASFEKNYKTTDIQYQRFISVLSYLEEQKIEFGMRHIANSAAALRFPQTRLDAVRVGSALLGRLSCDIPLSLHKIGRMQATVTDVITLKKGSTSGYASIFKAKKDVRAAVVPFGFSSGFGLMRKPDSFRFIDTVRAMYHDLCAFRRSLTVRFDGKTLPVLGRVGNQYTLVDATNSDIKVGDTVTADVNILMVDSLVERELTEE